MKKCSRLSAIEVVNIINASSEARWTVVVTLLSELTNLGAAFKDAGIEAVCISCSNWASFYDQDLKSIKVIAVTKNLYTLGVCSEFRRSTIFVEEASRRYTSRPTYEGFQIFNGKLHLQDHLREIHAP
jgi:hypothetical protein